MKHINEGLGLVIIWQWSRYFEETRPEDDGQELYPVSISVLKEQVVRNEQHFSFKHSETQLTLST